jgi:hypothetical protein
MSDEDLVTGMLEALASIFSSEIRDRFRDHISTLLFAGTEDVTVADGSVSHEDSRGANPLDFLAISRETELPQDCFNKDIMAAKIADFTLDTASMCSLNTAQLTCGRPTLGVADIKKAAKNIANFFQKIGVKELRILDTFSGNGCASKIIYDAIALFIVSYIATDILDMSTFFLALSISFEQLSAPDAVEVHGLQNNVLMMVCPTPGDHFHDLYAVHGFIIQHIGRPFWIVFIGELGASDGSTGMYKYMKDNSHLELKVRKPISTFHNGIDVVEKELFIWQGVVRCIRCTSPSAKQCSRCHKVYYCGATCQSADWPVHKKTCKKY